MKILDLNMIYHVFNAIIILSPNSCLIDIIPGLEQVKEQRREFHEVRCHFGIFDAEQPVRSIQRLFPKRTSV